MTMELMVVLGLLGAAIVMFAIGRPRMDAVALLMLTVLPFTGVLTMSEALAGFADANVVLIATLFIIGEGLHAKKLESLYMGCVSMTSRVFDDGVISEKRMRRARLAAPQRASSGTSSTPTT